MREIQITDNIYYIGTNDRKKHLFENNWPLPKGVSYNSYIIPDRKSALIDTIEFGSDDDYLDKIGRILGGRPLDYLVVNHMEPDHSSMIRSLLSLYPNLKLIGNNQTFKLLQSFYQVKEENFLRIGDGDELELGQTKLKFFIAPWVHWPETMVTYEVTSQTLFACDAFGGFGTLDGGIFDYQNDFEGEYMDEMRRYYSNIVGKYSGMVQKALAKLAPLDIKIIAPSHGLIWKGNPQKVISLYDQWSRYESQEGVVIAFASMYGNTEKMADYIGYLLAAEGIRNIHTFDVSKTHVSYILSEIWKYKGLILGTCAYNTQMHPMMEHLCNEIRLVNPKNKIISVFGSSSWNGAGVKGLKKFLDENGMPYLEPVIEVFGCPLEEKMQDSAQEMVRTFAAELKK